MSRPLKRSKVETFSGAGASEKRSNMGALGGAGAAVKAGGAGLEVPPKAEEKSAKSSPSSSCLAISLVGTAENAAEKSPKDPLALAESLGSKSSASKLKFDALLCDFV